MAIVQNSKLVFYQHILFALAILFLPVWACTQNHDVWEDWKKQRRSWEEMLKDTARWGGGLLRVLPDSSGFFYFRIDTSNGDWRSEMRQFFRFGPQGENFLFPPEFREFDRMFERFFKGFPKPLLPQPWPEFPADDGEAMGEDNLLPEERLRLKENSEQRDSDLLPEERLRQQERQNSPKKDASPKPTDPPKKAPDVKTIRI
ncbi:MAG: hypothetical protein NZM43_06695 [Saprospiraceae bacterium]|nr:hypothetical protein [Saprospiraceae bacterium]MDW8483999.1 hypothetical protein [Saprospiraceae bacterium]